ncbi:MAG: GPP34 family phosphoprotein [Candidatus Lokiarchaeota archaeon]|nr:GPP34 family phosphoprotein [Candidatus Lokiarchaeota archaeon]
MVSLENWKRQDSITPGASESICLAGAWIMDLILREKLLIEGKQLRVVDTNSTGDEYLDEILTILKDSKKMRKLKRWVDLLSRRHIFQNYTVALKRLESQGILKFEGKVTARIFYKFSYNYTKPEVKQSLLEQIQKVLINNVDPDSELLCLLSLIRFSSLYKVCIPKEYSKAAKLRIEDLLRSGNYDPSLLEMISKIKKAYRSTLSSRY